ncbi:type IV secretory system conjugative DNA transfer family protein [Tolypothrix sp. VBCCA 56010]|uniref:type IV secretory system conjugative DNA transfer family protein n=1 Tax=Tolypothrix sp. VBCCA 56010 TaxID=3137731 RepID=UPI003D7DD051
MDTIANAFTQAWVRWLAIAAALFCWNQWIGFAPGALTGIGLTFLATPYLFYVGCKLYLRFLASERTHVNFWLWFGGLLFLGGLFCLFTGYISGLTMTAIGAFFLDRNTKDLGDDTIHLRGGKISTLQQSRTYYDKSRPKTDKGLEFGGVQIPTREAVTHIAYCGTVGSGKTVSIRLFMQDALTGIGQLHCNKRAVLYDPKIEFYSILEGMGFQTKDIIVMNPFDVRCRPWWISKDMETATDAETLANILVPEKEGGKGDDDFWRSATIIAIKAVVRYLNRTAPHKWTFRDLLFALRSRVLILKMIDDEPRLNHYRQTFGTDKTADNIMATLLTNIEKYEPIAALWHKAETVYGRKPYSLTEWTEESKIILLGKSETAFVQMREINRVIITRLSQLLLEKPETSYPESYLIFDELSSLGNMVPLINLAEQGRSKGVSLVIGFQSKKHLEHNFGENLAVAFLGQFNHIAALRLREEETAKWIAGIIGKWYGMRYTSSVSSSWNQPDQHSFQEQYFEEYVVDPGELTAIPAFRPDLGKGLKGFYYGHVNWWCTYHADIVKSLTPLGQSKNFDPMPKRYQELDIWEDDDYKRLGIRHLQEKNGGIDLNQFFEESEGSEIR